MFSGVWVWRLVLGVSLLGVLFWYSPWRDRAPKSVHIASRGLVFEVVTEAATVGEVVAEAGMATEHAYSNPPPPAELRAGMRIEYRQAFAVDIVDDRKRTRVLSAAQTVGDLLEEAGIAVAPTDRLIPAAGTYVHRGLTVTIERIVTLDEVVESAVPFSEVVKTDSTLWYGKEIEQQPGRPGKQQTHYKVTYRNGTEVSRRKVSTRIVEAPINRLVRVGRKIVIEAREQGRASWYLYQSCLCAAHPSFSRGSFVRVTNSASGRSVIVRINDWGPDQAIHPDRIIDLDAVAFQSLAPLGTGTINVMVEKFKAE